MIIMVAYMFSKDLSLISKKLAQIHKDQKIKQKIEYLVAVLSDSICITISYKILIDSMYGI